MKRKGVVKKLVINREPLRVLDRTEAEAVNGGDQSNGAPCGGGGITKVRPMATSQHGICGGTRQA